MTSTIKVNNIQNQCGANIINENSNTITIGASGDTIALASGASQSGFGRTGTVDWQTGSIKTGTFSATNGEGYFVNTAGSTATANLPAGSAGAIVAFADYNNNFATNKFTITPNGSDKIGGENIAVDLTTDGQSVTLVFVDSTEGWVTVNDSSENIFSSPFIVASGGTETTAPCGNIKIHTFTGPGSFIVSSAASTAANNTVGYMVIAGGGSGGSCCAGGGGGAGGYREGRNVPVDNFTASPLVADAPTNAVTVTATTFPITVGAGGSAVGPGNARTTGLRGSNSIFSTITSTGGGGGYAPAPIAATPGGSGGGASHGNCSSGVGTGNTPPTTPSQGNDGGAFTTPNPTTTDDGGGAGGGAGGAGNPSAPIVGQGGAGVSSEITGSAVTRAAGGSAGMRNNPGSQPNVPVPPAPGGGGAGGGSSSYPRPAGQAEGGAGTANTGGGGGGGARSQPGCSSAWGQGGAGGSGIVVIRYKFQ
jgi:hypothetical protein